jgi:hypothetical protein
MTLAWLLAFALQATPPAPVQAAPVARAAPVTTADDASTKDEAPAILEPWPGTFASGFEAVRAHTEKSEFEEALHVCDQLLAPSSFLRWRAEQASKGGWRGWLSDAADPLLDCAGWNALAPASRGEIHFAKGVVEERAKRTAAAEESFGRARELAGSGDLRLDSIYDLGCLALSLGEEERAKIPEISGKPPQPKLPASGPGGIAGNTPGGAPGAAQPEPDPLQLARAAYTKARDHFVERLKSDWHDSDTQANVELVMKRLKELDDLEKQRQEQQKKQQDQKDQKDKKDQKDQDKKPDSKKDDKDKSKDEKNDKQDPSPDKPDKPDEKKDAPKPEDKKDDAQKKPEDQPKPDEKDKKDAQAADAKQQPMSKEEMMQILDRLRQIEEQAKKVQDQLRAMRKVKVKKDW